MDDNETLTEVRSARRPASHTSFHRGSFVPNAEPATDVDEDGTQGAGRRKLGYRIPSRRVSRARRLLSWLATPAARWRKETRSTPSFRPGSAPRPPAPARRVPKTFWRRLVSWLFVPAAGRAGTVRRPNAIAGVPRRHRIHARTTAGSPKRRTQAYWRGLPVTGRDPRSLGSRF
jgi:hypothetical protein